MKLGLDAYTIRSQGWDVFQQIDYCQRVGFQLLQTGIKAIPDLGSPALAKVRAFAQERAVELELALGCISPTTATAWPHHADS